MTKTEFLVVGQGISGTFLSWYLHKANRSFVVVDHSDPSASSRVAAGIINPVTGRRIVRTWMIETLMPFAVAAYKDLGDHLGIHAIAEKKIVDFFPSAQMKLAFEERINEGEEFLSIPETQNKYFSSFNYELGFGEISPAYMANLKAIVPGWANFLKEKNQLVEETFDFAFLKESGGTVSYKDLLFEKIIFCDGIYSSTNKYFKNLPFALNKGEAIIIEAEGIPENAIYKKALTIAPLGNNNYWVGSTHEWNFTDNLPSNSFFDRTKSTLSQWLKQPFNIVDHVAAIRPATIERRPFVGMHPHHPFIGILNGMGTKGCSLSPYFAKQLADHLTKNTPILAEADISRFSRILQSSI